MIQFEPLVSGIWSWLFAGMMLLILSFQLVWVLKSSLSLGRKTARIALNTLLALVLIAYVFQPVWKSIKPEQGVIVYASNVVKEDISFWKDSLNIKKAITIQKYTGEGNPVYLIGTEFSSTDLLEIGRKDIHWIGENELNSISYLEWKGILRQGENQTVAGRIEKQDSVTVSLSQQGVLVSETILIPNSGSFKLEFPTRVLGKNELDLMVNDSLYGSVNFFATAKMPIRYNLKFAFPDPDVRFLSQYLVNSGENITERIDISKNVAIHSGIATTDSLQFLIIDPSQLAEKATQEAIKAGASVLLININEVGNDISAINKAFETSFKTKRITSEERRDIESDLDAEPFAFETLIAQKLFYENAVAVQQIGNSKVGVSLLGKTFPIKLAGDSIRYQAIWQKILGAMMPQESGAVQITQPVFMGLKAEIQVNQAEFLDDFVAIESDSVFLQQSLINPFSKSGSFISLDSGWVSIGDSLEFYSYGAAEWPSLRASKLRADFLTEYSKKAIISQDLDFKRKISDWVWLSLFLALLTMVWVEPKVR
ncbi:hypothetical protein LV84_03119 [Algoriphagus ratkowskyi]|uniref:Aerotolerance regulator N-terminal domain-containing protein n=1 Tax=Algoriphagus ratkowskyi TaxID=57028 RepID=A0A2W7RRG2_9BACT|nr:hypothetical protein [Algoriphagus ratkowskyi]PZX53395.1 hypothetical protein LV84_03119 [Algoriphagus ratkowskyi]TXD76559.1 hypothetical protein ESW18_16295 [Algoriphagus ratkowskyi]